MFVGVTVVAMIVAYHVNWLRQRRELFAEEMEFGEMNSPEDDEMFRPPPAPGLLPLLGERGQFWFFVKSDAATPELISERDISRAKRARKLFPEAQIKLWHFHGGGWQIHAPDSVPNQAHDH
jgi:hypothetical protein